MSENELLPINHDDAYSLACMRREYSNMARCYIELHDRPTPAVSATVAEVDNVDRICSALCKSGQFETGEGTCAPICMEMAGDPRKRGCGRANQVHAKLAGKIVAALSPPTAKEDEHE